MSKERRLFKGGEMSMKRKWTLLFMTMAIMLWRILSMDLHVIADG